MSTTNIPAALRRLVTERAGGRCEYCLALAEYSPLPFHVDHITPESNGGATSEENLAYSCGCNNYKGVRTTAIDPETGQLVALFHPRRDNWRDHFAWNENALLVMGTTPTGRATVAALQMNRPGVLGFRGLLLAQGLHPP